MYSEPASIKEIAKRHMVDACVQAARNKGLSDACGVLRGVLFFAREPVSMDDLALETGYSKSTISSNMSLLESLGIARRVVTPGDKRYRYLPVYDPDSLREAMMTHVKKEVKLILGALDLAEKDMGAAVDGPEVEALQERMKVIRDFYLKAEQVLELMASYTTDELIEILKKDSK
ncbi:MAG: hypothetical protein GKC10_01095 [Methanosarcinales archaeon]|nr:hypothetical protein [Methanosarcinales archaeon]